MRHLQWTFLGGIFRGKQKFEAYTSQNKYTKMYLIYMYTFIANTFTLQLHFWYTKLVYLKSTKLE